MKHMNVNFRFFEFNGHADLGDSRVTEQVIAALGDYPWIERVPYNSDSKIIYRELKSCDAIFGVRLHSAILAYSAGVPFTLVEYHRKCSDFLDEIKYHQHLRVGDCAASSSETVNVLNQLLSMQHGSAVGDFAVADARIEAMKNFTEAPFFQPI
jgi:polysaccharide pyruvyl transferase WcaK-like protein